VWLLVGVAVGLAISGLCPHSPLHAVATDRVDTFAIATGPVDEEVEAFYFLDFLTGTLKAAVLSNATRDFQATYEVNIRGDLTTLIQFLNQKRAQENIQRRKNNLPALPEIVVPQNPKYLMVTGIADIRRGPMARARPSASAVYVAETTTGIVMAYILPWSAEDHSANRPSHGNALTLWAGDQFSTALIRTPD
jgi:hypothetical protein